MFYVYIHRKKVSGEVFYVGKGSGSRAWKISRDSSMWKSVSEKHGHEVEVVISGLQEWYAFEVERDLIALYGRRDKGIGTLVNFTDGGDGASGSNRSVETRAKIAAANIGKTISDETKEKMSLANKGRRHSIESRKKMSAALRGENHPNFGKKWSDAERKNLSNARKGRRSENHPWLGKTGDLHNSSKAVICVETGCRYGSASEAHRVTGVGRTGISLATLGKQKTAGGFSWRLA